MVLPEMLHLSHEYNQPVKLFWPLVIILTVFRCDYLQTHYKENMGEICPLIVTKCVGNQYDHSNGAKNVEI